MIRKKSILNAFFLLFLIAGSIYILGCRKRPVLHTTQGPVFGTYYHISYMATGNVDSLVLERLRQVDASLSMFNSQSTVSRINRGETDRADALFCRVFALSDSVWRLTHGAFDPTVAPLVNAWGFGFRQGGVVDSAAVDSMLAFVGMDKVRLVDGRVVKSDPRLMFDFSAVAKGFALDHVAALFDSLHIADYLIEIGGEVVTRGRHPEGRPWSVGIEKPADDDAARNVRVTLQFEDAALATSGNYRRYYERDGRRYAHTIDPHSGHPVQHPLLSATVVAPTCAMADALATAFMVMGADSARTIVERMPSLKAYLIMDAGDGHYDEWHSKDLHPSAP